MVALWLERYSTELTERLCHGHHEPRRKAHHDGPIPAGALVSGGALVWAVGADTGVQGRKNERLGSPTVKPWWGAAVEIETSDEVGESYEVEVGKNDGTAHDVALDRDLNVVRQEVDDDADNDDRALAAAERA